MIMQAAENDRTKLTIIVAGYSDKITEDWLSFNPGLPERFPFKIEFEDFSVAQLKDTFQKKLQALHWRSERATGVSLDVATLAANRLARSAGRPGFQNARSVRVLVEGAVMRATERIAADPDFQGHRSTLTKRDILGGPIDPASSPALRALRGMPGLDMVKKSIEGLVQLAASNFAWEEAG